MSKDLSFTNWWGKVCVLLDDPRLRWVLVEMVESDELVYTTKQLAKRVTERRRALPDGTEGALDENESLEEQVDNRTHALSAHFRDHFEELALVQRPAKAERDDQSVVFVNGWLTGFLARQELLRKEVTDLRIDKRGKGTIDYLERHVADERIEESKTRDGQYRLDPSLEAVLYAYVDECATLQSPEFDFEIGSPETLGEESETIFEALYEDTERDNRAAPMPKLPQHRDFEDYDKFIDYTIVGRINGIKSVQKPRELRENIEEQLLTWTAGAVEAYARSGDIDTEDDPSLSPEDAYPELPEDVIDKRSAEIVKAIGNDVPASRFGLHATIDDEASKIRFGLYLRTNIDTDKPIPSSQGGQSSSSQNIESEPESEAEDD